MTNTTILQSVTSILFDATKAFNGAHKATLTANTKREGSYSLAVKAAVEAGDGETLKTAYEALKVAIRSNEGGIARTLKCVLGKPDKEGNQAYTVPSSLQNAISALLAAYDYGVPMLDEDGEARSFSQIRSDKSAAIKAAKDAEMTPIQRAQEYIRVLAQEVKDSADAALDMGTAQQVAAHLAAAKDLLSGAESAESESEASEEALAA